MRNYQATFVQPWKQRQSRVRVARQRRGTHTGLCRRRFHGSQDFDVRMLSLDTGRWCSCRRPTERADPIKASTLKWFREGHRRKSTDTTPTAGIFRAAPEMSSCEPCFSWNVFHSHQSGDRQHYLEGMYSLFAGAVSRQTQTICETRGGVTGLAAATLMVYLARLAVVDDQIQEGSLHLLRMTPAAWLEGNGSTFERLPTEFGPVSIDVRDPAELYVTMRQNSARLPKCGAHVRPFAGLASAIVKGCVRKPCEGGKSYTSLIRSALSSRRCCGHVTAMTVRHFVPNPPHTTESTGPKKVRPTGSNSPAGLTI